MIRKCAFVLLLLALAGDAAANSISISPTAALDGTPRGIVVEYDSPPSLAFVQTDAPSAETDFTVTFQIDPGDDFGNGPNFDLPASGNVRIMNLFRDFEAGGTFAVVFLTRNSLDDSWRIFVMAKNVSGQFTACGGGFLTGLHPNLGSAVEVALTFEIGNNGRCTATRRPLLSSEPLTIFDTAMNFTGWSVSHVRIGSVSTTEVGTSTGELYLDEVEIIRN